MPAVVLEYLPFTDAYLRNCTQSSAFLPSPLQCTAVSALDPDARATYLSIPDPRLYYTTQYARGYRSGTGASEQSFGVSLGGHSLSL
jgi:hypothetical protein